MKRWKWGCAKFTPYFVGIHEYVELNTHPYMDCPNMVTIVTMSTLILSTGHYWSLSLTWPPVNILDHMIQSSASSEGITLVLVLIMRTHSFWHIFFPPLNWVTSSSDSACAWDNGISCNTSRHSAYPNYISPISSPNACSYHIAIYSNPNMDWN